MTRLQGSFCEWVILTGPCVTIALLVLSPIRSDQVAGLKILIILLTEVHQTTQHRPLGDLNWDLLVISILYDIIYSKQKVAANN
jgi:uncharacterized membrane protein YfcA